MNITFIGAKYTTNNTTMKNQMSSTASSYLDDLKKKHPKLTFDVGDGYINGAKNAVVLDKSFIEKLANDKELAKEFESELGKLSKSSKWLENRSNFDGFKIRENGILVDKDGNMTAYCTTDNQFNAQRVSFFGKKPFDAEDKNWYKKLYDQHMQNYFSKERQLYDERTSSDFSEQHSTYEAMQQQSAMIRFGILNQDEE